MRTPSTMLLVMVLIGCKSYKKHSAPTLRIQCKQCPNKILLWDYSFYKAGDTIMLDSNGEAIIPVPPDKFKQFINAYINCAQFGFTVFIDLDFDLGLKINETESTFFGKGSHINNYLLKNKQLLTHFQDSMDVIENPHDETPHFIQLVNDLETKSMQLYRQYYDSIAPTKDIEYLLKANTLASILLKKEEFLYNFNASEIDSLDLLNQLGFNTNNLLNDTLLINHCPFDFDVYLNENRDRYFNSVFTLHKNDHNSNTIQGINIIENAPQYSREIKDHLLFAFLVFRMKSSGPTHFLDSIITDLTKQHKISLNDQYLLSDIKSKYSSLLPGHPAPPLQGISPDGKVYALNDFKGKVIFIDIWATWCAPCLEALPHVLDLKQKFESNHQVAFLFLSNDSKEEVWKKYLETHPEFTGVHLRARKEEDRPLEEAWKVTGIPRYMLIDKKGNIIDAFVKNHSFEEIQLMIEKALKN